jgi:hypothetical protein
MGIPVGDLSPQGMGMRKKCSSKAFMGILAGKFFIVGTGMGSYSLAGNSPLPSLQKGPRGRAQRPTTSLFICPFLVLLFPPLFPDVVFLFLRMVRHPLSPRLMKAPRRYGGYVAMPHHLKNHAATNNEFRR